MDFDTIAGNALKGTSRRIRFMDFRFLAILMKNSCRISCAPLLNKRIEFAESVYCSGFCTKNSVMDRENPYRGLGSGR